jgi:hypothetical protein
VPALQTCLFIEKQILQQLWARGMDVVQQVAVPLDHDIHWKARGSLASWMSRFHLAPNELPSRVKPFIDSREWQRFTRRTRTPGTAEEDIVKALFDAARQFT